MDHARAVCESLDRAVGRAAGGARVAVAFSGGLDSGIVAALAKRHAEKAVLYTAGADGSHDMRAGGDAASRLDMDWVPIVFDEASLESALRGMISATGTSDPLTLSFEAPLFFVCGACSERIVIGGQGADEAFAGYSKYVGLGEADLRSRISEDLARLRGEVAEHERKVASGFGKSVAYPFLDEGVLSAAASIPFEDLRPQGDGSRKGALRGAADLLGCPFLSERGKKAAQYGSGATQMIRRMAKGRGMGYGEFISSLAAGAGP
ncbi:MAG: asparagine synthase C-terminal domain-containing protein [Candidatus Methanoplasma sp.]|jgi:asparagine synthase (glutamine-hydrolysing)|nr:asparagine synthase C-terminal domain-containing protein [Candidatus Methanoplasma sp.]